jgi:hypothetical protein
MLESGLSDDFLIYRALAHEYGTLQDTKANQKINALYIRKVDSALEEALQ